MGTTKSGRYMNTKGSGTSPSQFAVVHSNEGSFKWTQIKENGKTYKRIRLASGGNGQRGIELLEKYGIKYKVVTTLKNGVRLGYVENHKNRKKRSGTAQAWFPKTWSEKDIKRAGEQVAHLKRNRHVADGIATFGTYKGVRVGVIRRHGKIATIFPDTDQSVALRRRKR